MPATYRHVHKFSSNRSTWQKPEPAKTHTQKKFYILGVEVDRETYWEHEKALYELSPGYRVPLYTVKYLAESKDLTDATPKEIDEATAAKHILAQIRAEITGGKDKMKTPKRSSDFIAELNEIYTESRSAYGALQKKVDTAKAKMDRAYDDMRDPACPNRQMAEARYTVAKGEHQLAEEECRIGYNKLMETHRTRVDELRTKFADHLGDRYAVSPDEMDASTVQMLNSGICTASDLARLAERYAENPTMLRILGSYAGKLSEDKHLSDNDRTICAVVKHKASIADGSLEMRLFNDAVSVADYGLGKDYAHASQMHDAIVANAFEGYRQSMDAIIGGTTEK